MAIKSGALLACLAIVLAGLATLGPGPRADSWGLAQLMQTLSQRGPESARFVEKKYLAILDQPVESSGELRYVPPDRLEKLTQKPKPESLVLAGNQLTVERSGQQHTLRLQDYPEVAAFVDSIRGTLSGDRKALERVYRLEVHGDAERWSLLMLPSDSKLAALVQRIDVAGTRDRVRSITILQGDGDRSAMTIERVDPAPARAQAPASAPATATKASPR